MSSASGTPMRLLAALLLAIAFAAAAQDKSPEELAASNNPADWTSLGTMYLFGSGDGKVAVDRRKALEWLERAGATDDVNALAALGLLYSLEGPLRDPARSFSWYLRGAQLGHPMSQSKVGDAYRTGEGVARDDRLAFQWYSRAAAEGWGDALYRVATFHAAGVVVPKDDRRAVELYKLASDRGSPAAMTVYGLKLVRGEGVDKDAAKGSALIWRAARRGYPRAQYLAAQFYLKGKEADPVLAYAWTRLAASKGYEPARTRAEEMKAKLSPADAAEGDRLAAGWLGGLLKRETPAR
jgi:TPR repeat protein